MKKTKAICLAAMTALAMTFTACEKSSDSDSPSASSFTEEYFSSDQGSFHPEALPETDSDVSISDVIMNDQALSGGSNFISIESDTELDRFYIGVDGQSGYIEIPATSASTRAASPYIYLIDLSYGKALSGSFTILIKARTRDGKITKVFRKSIKFVKSKEGALTINLTFNQKKDLDLHLQTPSGKHIYYDNRTLTCETASGEKITYGLDHDSNADCNIDGLNNENIVIPEEAIEAGEYTVYLEMYKNCDKSIGTDLSWKLYVRYNGNVVRNTITIPSPGENSMAFTDGATTLESGASPHNPVWGTYPYNHYGRTQKYVMKFTVKSATRSREDPVSWNSYVPTLQDIAKRLDAEEGID